MALKIRSNSTADGKSDSRRNESEHTDQKQFSFVVISVAVNLASVHS